MKIKGISDDEMAVIKSIIQPFCSRYEFFAYGSRVKGNFRKLSDLDILIKSNSEIDFSDIEIIKQNFDESDLPYIVNLSDRKTMSESFYKIIEPDLIKLL